MSSNPLLSIEGLTASVDEKTILHNVNLNVAAGETHVLMGPNGAGKSTLGHLVMGAQEVQQCAESLGLPQEKSLLLQHMILSHHGEPDFGAAVRPMCAEAELLSLIDLVDSRMEIYAEALQELPEGTFSGRIFALDKKIYRHH